MQIKYMYMISNPCVLSCVLQSFYTLEFQVQCKHLFLLSYGCVALNLGVPL